VQVQIALARLHDEGIPAWAHQDWSDGGLALTVGICGRIDVLVPASMLSQAQTTLKETMKIDFDDEDEEEQDSSPPAV
jgi:hypothetical protein